MPDQENPTTESVPCAGAPESPKWSILMHPVFFITASTLVGLLFALQQWGHMNVEGYQIRGAIRLLLPPLDRLRIAPDDFLILLTAVNRQQPIDPFAVVRVGL